MHETLFKGTTEQLALALNVIGRLAANEGIRFWGLVVGAPKSMPSSPRTYRPSNPDRSTKTSIDSPIALAASSISSPMST